MNFYKVIRNITVTGMLSAIAFILMFLEFPVPFLMPSFIKMDLSDLPALIGSFAIGPVAGVVICLIKNLIHLSLSQTGGVGELSNFLLGCAFVLPAGIIYKCKKTKKVAIIASAIGAVAMAALSFPINYFLVYPVYYAFMPKENVLAAYQLILPSVKNMPQALLIFNVPFTFVKAAIAAVITVLVYKPLSPILKGKGV